MELTTQCPRCQSVSKAMLLWHIEQKNTLKTELGTFSDLDTALDCKTCKAVAEFFRAKLGNEPPPSSRLYFGRMIHKQRFWIVLVRPL
jgi:hypothetical protein